MARIQIDDKLKIAFNFNNSDLQDNRQGFMSFRQKRKLRLLSLLKFDWIFAALVGMGFVLIPVGVIYGYIVEPINMPMPAFGKVLYVLSAALILVIYGVILYVVVYMRRHTHIGHWAKFNGDIRSGQVKSVEVEIDSRHKAGFSVSGGEACIRINPKQLFALHENYTYRLYYAPNTCEILSVEIVRVDRGPKDNI